MNRSLKKTGQVLVIFFCSVFIGKAVHAEQTRLTNPNVLGLEVLGRGLAYSVFFDRAMGENLGSGLGFGTVGAKNGSTAYLLPAYFTYYLQKDEASLFGTAGVTVVMNSSSLSESEAKLSNVAFPQSFILPHFGVGFEDRGDSGYLFRLAAYGFVASNFSLWVGFSFGYAF